MTSGIVNEVDGFGCQIASEEAEVDDVRHRESKGYRTDENYDSLGASDGMQWVVEAETEHGMGVFLVLNPVLALYSGMIIFCEINNRKVSKHC